ncbi:MAG: zinc-ribbon domain-containing protein [Candidatus Heimdallarchaeum endolithica]|uniref:Zinc-ribbon domain-containing protein n=1 Tax=Candidatus Heimdallarchaeum endolithica TaxID=2876572 RepID=A0A9Y1BSH2_9ARCH|nr:MAG: zinc-ribbon domain-containing protein [Candidatus Heimdallarchaeum endolithica]
MARCKYCYRTIPDEAEFCPYCGKERPIRKIVGEIEGITKKVKAKIEKRIPTLRKQALEILERLSSKAKQASFPGFVDRSKVITILNDLKSKLDAETDQSKIREYSEWANLIEQTISGENCIICYQPFDIHDGEHLDVSLCPSCHYAAHNNHFEAWLDKKAICPICKASISKNQLVKGYIQLKEGELVFTSSEKQF